MGLILFSAVGVVLAVFFYTYYRLTVLGSKEREKEIKKHQR